MDSISKKYTSYKFTTPYARVISMNTTELPLTLQLAIENFTPANDVNSPNKKAYARELLIRYKLELIKMIKNDPSININLVIESMQEK